MVYGGCKKYNLGSSNPLITVITVVYNDKVGLETTIKSVIEQKYDNLEYIIIDGNSSDGTLELIKKYEDKISYWQSEPDNGIYDAMNKGIEKAKGQWINFMNSGDCFYDNFVLKDIFENGCYDCDVIFGNSIEVNKDGEESLKIPSANSCDLYRGVTYRHGASFVKSDVHKLNMFDINRKDLGYALDYNCIYNLNDQGFLFSKVDVTVLKYEKEGTSNHPIKNMYYVFKITSRREPIRAFLRFIRYLVIFMFRKEN